MKPFMDTDFLLTTPTARTLYHEWAAHMPIVDYHCHVSPREIYEDKRFQNITQVWLAGDHYKWRLMRGNGVAERYITGDATDREKFQKFAEALPRAIGNPMYHWCHLELQRYFGYTGVLNGDSAEEVWQLTARKLQEPGMGVRGLIEQSNVAFVGTTDDPIDTLEWHKKLAADDRFSTVVAPSFRPDKALNIDKAGWADYIATLSAAAGVDICNLATLKEALCRRMDHFAAHGCRASDHGLDYMVFRPAEEAEIDAVLAKGLAGEAVTAEEAAALKTALLLFCAGEYKSRGWVMHEHFFDIVVVCIYKRIVGELLERVHRKAEPVGVCFPLGFVGVGHFGEGEFIHAVVEVCAVEHIELCFKTVHIVCFFECCKKMMVENRFRILSCKVSEYPDNIVDIKITFFHKDSPFSFFLHYRI